MDFDRSARYYCAVAIVFYPVQSSLAFTWVLGMYALIHGVTTVGFMQFRSARISRSSSRFAGI